jgi:hypothetical protein
VWGFISKYLVLQVSHLPTTLLSLLRLLPCWATIVAACRRYHCGEKKLKSTVLHILFHFALAMTIVSLMAKATATTMATATERIHHCLIYDSNKMIVVIIYFSFFS